MLTKLRTARGLLVQPLQHASLCHVLVVRRLHHVQAPAVASGALPSASTVGAMQAQEAAALVQRQLELYNARDVDAFMTIFHEDVQVMDGITGAVLASSKAQLRPRYVERFKSPVCCELLGRLVLGNVVVDREIITGLPDDGVADCMATYVCEANLISKITFVWKPRTVGVKL